MSELTSEITDVEDAATDEEQADEAGSAEAVAAAAAALGADPTDVAVETTEEPGALATALQEAGLVGDAGEATPDEAEAAEEEQPEPAAEVDTAAPAETETAEGETEGTESAEAAEQAAAAEDEEAAAAEDDEADAAEDEEASEDGDAEAVAVVPDEPPSPYDLPGSWYVVHSYSGYENKVKANLETRIKSMHLEDKVFDVQIPMEEVVEFKAGRKVNVMRKKFPGYILVRLYLDDDSWYAVRNTPGVTGFVGSGTKPSPLSRREVERILGVRKDEEKKPEPRFKPAWEVGETVRVVEGPFADFNGVIEDINVDQSKVRVLVDIFGRETPVELNFDQIVKY